MQTCFVRLAGQAVRLRYPAALQPLIASLLPGASKTARGDEIHDLTVLTGPHGAYSIESHCAEPVGEIDDGDLPRVLLEEIGRSLVYDLKPAVAIHAGAVARQDAAILVVGQTGAGKSSLIAWLASHGFSYLTDELIVVHPDLAIEPHRRPIIIKPAGIAAVRELPVVRENSLVPSGPNQLIAGLPATARRRRYNGRQIVFVSFAKDEDIAIVPLTPAQTAMRLMASNLNARNLTGHGLGIVRDLASVVPAIELTYGHFDQLEGVIDHLIDWSIDRQPGPLAAKRLLSAFRAPHDRFPAKPTAALLAAPAATTGRFARKLTVGMATYDDFDGAYFSLQALRLYHKEVADDVELVVVDNHPTGPAAKPLKDLERWIKNYRYVPRVEMSGTAIRNAVFEEASGAFVLCIDSHVLIEPGALRKLIAYADARPGSDDLLQGPLIYDDLAASATHFEPKWRRGMYGYWGTDPRGADPDGPPFDIEMQGLGLFGCRRSAWLPFNPAFRGFGGEEGYIHEKFRQAGRRTLCLPFLRWLHRFQRPRGVPYTIRWADRIRNYWIGLNELGRPTDEMEAHFRDLLGADKFASIMEDIHDEFDPMPPGRAGPDR